MRPLENLLIATFALGTVTVFLSLLVYGGLFQSTDSILFTEISYLISPYSPPNYTTIPLYVAYIIFLILFSLFLAIRLPNIYAKIGAVYLMGSGALGLMLLDFPLDPRGISYSPSGITHISMLLFMSFYVSSALLLFSYAFGKIKRLSWLAKVSYVTCIALLIGGFFTGIFAWFSMPAYVGFVEKIPIAFYLGWIFLTGIGLLISDRRIKNFFKSFSLV